MRGKTSKLLFKALDGFCAVAGFTLYWSYIRPKHTIKQELIHYRFHRRGIPHIKDSTFPAFPCYTEVRNGNGKKK
jgi:hypothetical protein